jgi:hypothetical protein
MEWSDRDLELAVIDSKGTHPVAFFRVAVFTDSGWIDVETNNQLCFNFRRPTHWRDWVLN